VPECSDRATPFLPAYDFRATPALDFM
jgi:hypothetical protein